YFFFFQAEDGIRDFHVTGVQTCALPIFQIKDDLFDYGDIDVGKPLGIDIKERKMTLPLIHALSRSNWSTKRKIIGIIKNESHNRSEERRVGKECRSGWSTED